MQPEQVLGKEIAIKQTSLVHHTEVAGELAATNIEREIVWVAESSTNFEFWHGGKQISKGLRFNDFSGYLTSACQKEAQTIADEYAINTSSSLELRAYTTITLTPYLENDECRAKNKLAREMQNKLHLIRPTSRLSIKVSPDDKDSHSKLRALGAISITNELTWSSQRSDDENLIISKSFKDKWNNNDSFAQFIP